MEEIQKWFEGEKDYQEGVDLYAKMKHNKNTLRLFKLKENPVKKSKLEYELSQFLPKYILPKAEKPITVVTKVNIEKYYEQQSQEKEKKSRVLFHQLPPELRPELLKANDLFRKNCLLKVTLNELPDVAENEALRIIIEIDANQKDNAACWSKIDYWLKHRVLPKESKSNAFDGLTAAELVKRQQYLFVNVSKKKSALAINRKALKNTTSLTEHKRIEKLIAKQESFLLKYNEDLRIITKIINGE